MEICERDQKLNNLPGPDFLHIPEEHLEILFPDGMERTFYKVVTQSHKSNIHNAPSDFAYDPPGEDGPGEWCEIHDDPKLCEHGIHITTDPLHWIQRPFDRIYKVEAKGINFGTFFDHPLLPITLQRNKFVCATIRLVEEIERDEAHEIHQKLHATDQARIEIARQERLKKLEEEREEARKARIAHIAERYAEANRNGQVFVPEDVDKTEFLTNFMKHHDCPHCDYQIKSFILEEDYTVYSTETTSSTLKSDGSTDHEYGDSDCYDQSLEEARVYYGCGGNNCQIEESDFEGLLVFESSWMTFDRFVTDALEN